MPAVMNLGKRKTKGCLYGKQNRLILAMADFLVLYVSLMLPKADQTNGL